MQKFSQKYTIVSLLEDLPVGYEFAMADWPQHVTLADVFAADMVAAKNELEKLAGAQSSLKSTIVGEDHFGDDKSVHVLLLDKTPQLVELHEKIVKSLENHDVVFNNPQFTHGGFRPHTTVRDATKLKVDNDVVLNNVAVIDMFPNENPFRRKIIMKYNLT